MTSRLFPSHEVPDGVHHTLTVERPPTDVREYLGLQNRFDASDEETLEAFRSAIDHEWRILQGRIAMGRALRDD